MRTKRFIVWPGTLQSQTDGQWHYVGFTQLCALYQVHPSECINGELPEALLGVDQSGMVHLTPRYDGHYSLPGGREEDVRKP